jgi:hypothetical protein
MVCAGTARRDRLIRFQRFCSDSLALMVAVGGREKSRNGPGHLRFRDEST